MATYYFDWVNGADANAGTIQLPKKSLQVAMNTALGSAGDGYLSKRGTTQIIDFNFTAARAGSSETVRTRFGVYGESDVSYATITNPSGTGNMVFNCAGRSWIDFEDIRFDAAGVCSNVIYAAVQGSSNVVGQRYYRCHFKNAVGSGFNVGIEGGKTGTPSGFVFEDCEAYDNGGHGIILSAANTSVARRSKFYRNGALLSTGGHGFSAGAAKTPAPTGWTNTGGAIWQRTLAANETDVYYVQTSVSGYPRLNKNTSTPASPASGEFGVSGTVLYVNVGVDPSGKGVIYAWKRAFGLVIEDCEAYENYWNRSAPYHEGHGFAFDDFTDDSFFRGNRSYNNQGLGFSINRGDRNSLVGNIAHDNWSAAVSVNTSADTTVTNNTFLRNNAGTDPANAEIVFGGYTKRGIVSNNDVESTVSYGVDVSPTGTSGFSGTKNNICGHRIASESNPFLTATTNVDSLRDALYRPRAPELIRSGASLGGRDFYGRRFYSLPNIGAVEDLSTTSRYVISL